MLVAGTAKFTPVIKSGEMLARPEMTTSSSTESNFLAFSVNEENFEKSGNRVQNISVYPVIANDLGSRNGSFQNTQFAVYNRIEHSYYSCIKKVQAETINKSPLIKSLRI